MFRLVTISWKFKKDLKLGRRTRKSQAEVKRQSPNIACGLPLADFSPLPTYHAFFLPWVSM